MREGSWVRGRCHSKYFVLLALILATVTGNLWAQLPTGTILGTIRDASGAVVPGATVTIREVDTGLTRTTQTGDGGEYRVPALPVGHYDVKVEHSGFKTETQQGMTLDVSQEMVVNFTLQVGTTQQEVVVTAEAPLVNTTNDSLGGLVNEQKVADLPLNGRNYTDLTLLQPGIADAKNITNTGTQAGEQYSSNGAPTRSNSYLLDGAIMSNLFATSAASISGSTLGIDGIREYKVVTTIPSAEYGMTMGSWTTIATKSGTNQFHGDVFEFLRNNDMDARNFFDYGYLSGGGRLPHFERNNFGGAVGGPIQKDKTFFFLVYEGIRQDQGQTTISNVLPPGCHGAAGAVITNTACSLLGTSVHSVTIAPQIAPILAIYPLPNLPNNEFTYPFAQPTDENYWQGRLDHTFSSKDTAFGRFTSDNTTQVNTSSFPQFGTFSATHQRFATISESHVFSPTLLSTTRFSFSRFILDQSIVDPFTGSQYALIPGKAFGSISVGGATALGPSVTLPGGNKQNVFTTSEDLFYQHGRHSFKFGALFNHYQQYMISGGFSRGSVTFPNTAAFLQAIPSQTEFLTPGSISARTYHFNTLGFYVQDDLRVNSRVTLNLGVRYEFNTVPYEEHGVNYALRDPATDTQTIPGPVFVNNSLHNFSPRIGFAWDVFGDGKTSLRGGFAEMYDIMELGLALIEGISGTPPASSLTTYVPPVITLPLTIPAGATGTSLQLPDYHMSQPHILEYSLTAERQLPYQMSLSLSYVGTRGMDLMQEEEGNPVRPSGTTVNGVLNPLFWTGKESRINPHWANIAFITAGGDSWYNSLQANLTKRLSSGFQIQGSYTFARMEDDTQGEGVSDDNATTVYKVDTMLPYLDKSLSAYDVRNNLRINAIYNFPRVNSGGFVGGVLNGWWTSGILSLQNGFPFTPTLNTNRSRSQVDAGAAAIDRPNLNSGRNNANIVSGTTAGCGGATSAGEPLGTPTLYYDPCAFSLQPAGFLGTAGRDILIGPGFYNLDFSVVKDTPVKYLGEGGKVEFRAEFFNIMNRPNFAQPNRTVFAGTLTDTTEAPLTTAGQITATQTPSRQIQLALKVLF